MRLRGVAAAKTIRHAHEVHIGPALTRAALDFFGDPQVLEDDLDAAFDHDYS